MGMFGSSEFFFGPKLFSSSLISNRRYLDDSTDQLAKGQLAKMFSRHDLAELIADIALMVATSWFPEGASKLQRHSLLCCFVKGDRKKILSKAK